MSKTIMVGGDAVEMLKNFVRQSLEGNSRNVVLAMSDRSDFDTRRDSGGEGTSPSGT